MSDHSVLAHGIGGAKDLPIPLPFAVTGAAVALVISFVVLARAWRTSRWEDATAGRPAPPLVAAVVDAPWARGAVRVVGLLLTALLLWTAIAGADAAANPALGLFYIYVWVGMVPLSLLLGHVWPLLSPARTLHVVFSRVLGSPPEQGMLAYPARLGSWPAALGLFAFVWTELVDPDVDHVSTVTTWVLVWLAVLVVGAAVFGEEFLARADPFEAWFGLVARLSPWDRRDGRLVVRSPLANLARTPPAPGVLAVLSVLLGSTAFDSFSTSIFWLRQTSVPGPVDPVLLDTLVLVGFVALVQVTFSVAAKVGTGLSRDQRSALPRLLAHSLVPIGVGYVFAHYLTLLLESGQAYLIFLSDPLVTGDTDYLGTGDWTVVYFLSQRPGLLATLKVGFVLAGHVVAVVAAHDRALRLLPEHSRVRGQVGMLVLMLVYTVGGLLLLFSA